MVTACHVYSSFIPIDSIGRQYALCPHRLRQSIPPPGK